VGGDDRAAPDLPRDGANICILVPRRMTQVALGRYVEASTINSSRAHVAMPTGMQTSDRFRLRGKDLSILRSAARGGMYV